MADKLQQLHAETIRIAELGAMDGAESVEMLLQLREETITELAGLSVVSQHQKQLIAQIQSYDGILLHQMEAVRTEASRALEKINQSKIQKNRYEQQYDADSYFIDKRK